MSDIDNVFEMIKDYIKKNYTYTSSEVDYKFYQIKNPKFEMNYYNFNKIKYDLYWACDEAVNMIFNEYDIHMNKNIGEPVNYVFKDKNNIHHKGDDSLGIIIKLIRDVKINLCLN